MYLTRCRLVCSGVKSVGFWDSGCMESGYLIPVILYSCIDIGGTATGTLVDWLPPILHRHGIDCSTAGLSVRYQPGRAQTRVYATWLSAYQWLIFGWPVLAAAVYSPIQSSCLYTSGLFTCLALEFITIHWQEIKQPIANTCTYSYTACINNEERYSVSSYSY